MIVIISNSSRPGHSAVITIFVWRPIIIDSFVPLRYMRRTFAQGTRTRMRKDVPRTLLRVFFFFRLFSRRTRVDLGVQSQRIGVYFVVQKNFAPTKIQFDTKKKKKKKPSRNLICARTTFRRVSFYVWYCGSSIRVFHHDDGYVKNE